MKVERGTSLPVEHDWSKKKPDIGKYFALTQIDGVNATQDSVGMLVDSDYVLWMATGDCSKVRDMLDRRVYWRYFAVGESFTVTIQEGDYDED